MKSTQKGTEQEVLVSYPSVPTPPNTAETRHDAEHREENRRVPNHEQESLQSSEDRETVKMIRLCFMAGCKEVMLVRGPLPKPEENPFRIIINVDNFAEFDTTKVEDNQA